MRSRAWLLINAATIAALGAGCGPGWPLNTGRIVVDGGTDDGGDRPPCMGPSDPRLVLAPQRIVRLSKVELVNTVAALLGDDAGVAILSNPSFSEVNNETLLRVPLLASIGEAETINNDPDSFPEMNDMAQAAGDYVLANFDTVTGCVPATDACASDFISTLAARAYRRDLTADEGRSVLAVYDSSKTQLVNGWDVTSTIQEATSNAVHAIFAAPQTLWRREVGDTTAPAGETPGIPLTDNELATSLAYFLTGRPPDDELLEAAGFGTLRAELDAQTVRLLATPEAQAWLSKVMLVVYGLNRIYETRVDPDKFPAIEGSTLKDMHDEAKLFLDDTLWNGNIEDVLLSRKTFVNSNLAAAIYNIPVPDGASATNFVATMLPEDQRAGLLTNPAFLTSQAGTDQESVIYRGVAVDKNFLCLSTDSFPEEFRDVVAAAKGQFEVQTAQEQAAFRHANAACYYCHQTFDPYGLALDGYDNIGRFRTNVSLADGRVEPVDAHATLPPVLGGGSIMNAIDLANALAGSDLFPACVARNVLQDAMSELTVYVDFPTPAGMPVDDDMPYAAGCAVQDAAARYKAAKGRTFADVVRAVVATPAFQRRNADQTAMAPADDAGAPDDDAGGAADASAPGDGGAPGDASAPGDGGTTGDAGGAPTAPDMLKTLVLRQTVLGFVVGEITRMRATVPPRAQGRLDLHTEAVQAVTSTIANSIVNIGPAPTAN